jgi:Zn finger protein HypA/HybF involved in hydrogenase expression
MKVRCNWCDEVFDEEEIIVIGETEYCPKCNTEGCLMDMEEQ